MSGGAGHRGVWECTPPEQQREQQCGSDSQQLIVIREVSVNQVCSGTVRTDGVRDMIGTMLIRWVLAAAHLLALGIGLGAIWARARALRAPLDSATGLRRVFYADTLWGLAAVLWIATGLTRAFGGFEKGTAYYLHNDFFLAKMTLLVAVLALEVWPMTTLMRWRIQRAHSERVRTDAAGKMAWISTLQAVLVVAMVFVAAAMARGMGERAS